MFGKCQTVFLSCCMSVTFLRILKSWAQRTPRSYSMFYLPLWGETSSTLSNILMPVGNLFSDKLISGATQLPPMHQINLPHFKIIRHSSCRGTIWITKQGGNLCLLNHPQCIALGQKKMCMLLLYIKCFTLCCPKVSKTALVHHSVASCQYHQALNN